MNPEDFTAQAQDKMKQVQQLTEDMQRAATRGQDSIAGMKCQIADMNNKILDEQKNIDRVTADYRSKIDAASQEAQRLNTQAAELAQKQADDAARAAM